MELIVERDGKRFLMDRAGNALPLLDEPQGTLSAYEPSVTDSFRWGLADILRDRIGMSTTGARDVSERIFGKPFSGPETDALTGYFDGMGIAGATGLSAIPEALQVVQDYRRGNYGDAALGGLDTAISAIPAIGAGVGLLRRGFRRGMDAIPDVVQTLARGRGYEIGDALRAASSSSSYTPPANKPGLLSLPGFDTRFEARPVSPIEEAATDYMRSRGARDFRPLEEYPAFSEDRARAIALAYADMAHDTSNPAVKRAYDAMIEETLAQYNALRDTGIDFRFLREGMSDPYAASPGLGYKDMIENGRLWVFPTDFGFGTSSTFDPSENPLLKRVGRIGDKADAVANDAFRVVHDAFGHYGPGNPFFRHQGEERAWVEHSRMYSPEARGAMTSETRGQNSWLNFGPYGEQNRKALGADTVFADQKTGLMPSWTYGLLSPTDERAAIEEFLRARGF